jgi:hypothetical protein
MCNKKRVSSLVGYLVSQFGNEYIEELILNQLTS